MPARSASRLLPRIATAIGWWWLMMAVHESGHVLGCRISGAVVESVTLWPWAFSETVRSGSRMPLVDTWAGPVVGVLLPVLVWAALQRTRIGPWLGVWAGFCLVVNGVYIGAGWLDGVGDAGDLLRHGAPWWSLSAFGLGCVVAGLLLWHRQLLASRSLSETGDRGLKGGLAPLGKEPVIADSAKSRPKGGESAKTRSLEEKL